MGTIAEVAAAVDRARKDARGQWWAFVGSVEGTTIRVKGYKTWVQRFECPSFVDGGAENVSVAAFRETVTRLLSLAVSQERN